MNRITISPMDASLTAIAGAIVFACMIATYHMGRHEAQRQCRAYEYQRTALSLPFKGGYE